VKLYIGGQYHRSSTCQGGGKNPHWNDTFFVTIPFNSDPTLRVEVWDDDAVEDDSVGMGQYNLAQYLSQQMSTTSKNDLTQSWLTFTTGMVMPEESPFLSNSTVKAWEEWAWEVVWEVVWEEWVEEWEWEEDMEATWVEDTEEAMEEEIP